MLRRTISWLRLLEREVVTREVVDLRRSLGVSTTDSGDVAIVDSRGLVSRYCVPPPRPLVKPVRAVLLDLDGTSLLSEDFWAAVLAETLARCGRTVINHVDQTLLRGGSTEEHLAQLMVRYGLRVDRDQVRTAYQEVVDERFHEASIAELADVMPIAEGFVALRDRLLALRLPMLLVTNGGFAKTAKQLEILAHHLEESSPDRVATGVWCSPDPPGAGLNSFGAGSAKPHPWPYFEAATRGAGLTEGELASVVGVDDSFAGVVSMRLAGVISYGLDSENVRALGASEFADRIISSLADVLDDLS